MILLLCLAVTIRLARSSLTSTLAAPALLALALLLLSALRLCLVTVLTLLERLLRLWLAHTTGWLSTAATLTTTGSLLLAARWVRFSLSTLPVRLSPLWFRLHLSLCAVVRLRRRHITGWLSTAATLTTTGSLLLAARWVRFSLSTLPVRLSPLWFRLHLSL